MENFKTELYDSFTQYRTVVSEWFDTIKTNRLDEIKQNPEETDKINNFYDKHFSECFSYFGFELSNNILKQRLNIKCDNKDLDSISIILVKEYYENDISVEDMVIIFREWLVEKNLELFIDVMKNVKFVDVLKKQFPTPSDNKYDSWSSIYCIVEDIYSPTYQQDDITINDVTKEKRLEFESIYDNMHDSDEECYLTVAKLDNQVICTIYKSGDRSEVVVNWISKELAVTTKKYLDKFLSKDNTWIDQINIMDEDQTFFDLAENQYLNFHKIDENLFYTMYNPRWGSINTRFHLGTFIKDEDEKLVPCKFKHFINKDSSYRNDYDYKCIVESYWKKIEISATDIYFQITKDKPIVE